MTHSDVLPALLLLGGILPLVVAPFIARWADRSQATRAAMDALIAVSLGGIVLLHIWPHALLTAGVWALVGGLSGLMLPFLLHGSLHSHERRIYPGIVALALAGLAFHAALDGVALFSPLVSESPAAANIAPRATDIDEARAGDHEMDHRPSAAGDRDEGAVRHHPNQGSATLLAMAVILHRLPTGLAVWWLTVPVLGRRTATFFLTAIAAATVLGFSFAGKILAGLTTPGIAVFEATIAGMLLHVAVGHHHAHSGSHHQDIPWASALGVLAGLGLTAGLGGAQWDQHAQAPSAGDTFTTLALALSPMLIVGLLLQATRSTIARRPPPRNRRRRTIGLDHHALWTGLSKVIDLLTLPAIFVSLALLGWRWTLLYVLAASGLTAIVELALLRRPAQPSETATTGPRAGTRPASRESTRASFLPQFERQAHRSVIWLLLGLTVVALMRPIVETGTNSGSLGSTLALVTVVLGVTAFCRNASPGIVLVFFLLHIGWPPVAALATVLFSTTRQVLRRWTSRVQARPPLWLIATAVLACLPILWSARLIQAPIVSGLLSEPAEPTLWHIGALATLVVSIGFSLFTRGFRGFLHPVFDPVPETGSEVANHGGEPPAVGGASANP